MKWCLKLYAGGCCCIACWVGPGSLTHAAGLFLEVKDLLTCTRLACGVYAMPPVITSRLQHTRTFPPLCFWHGRFLLCAFSMATVDQPPTTVPHFAGGYDHTVKLWDVRSGQAGMSFDHGSPVEDLAFFPSGGLLVTAGGTNLCVWDLLR